MIIITCSTVLSVFCQLICQIVISFLSMMAECQKKQLKTLLVRTAGAQSSDTQKSLWSLPKKNPKMNLKKKNHKKELSKT